MTAKLPELKHLPTERSKAGVTLFQFRTKLNGAIKGKALAAKQSKAGVTLL
jgi:hypothetical protein